MDKIFQFLLEHLPQYKKCKQFRRWLEWADGHGFLLRVWRDESEQELAAAAIVRPITKEQFAQEYDSCVFDQNGEILYIDACAAAGKQAMRGLGVGILNRFGPRLALAFNSHQRGNRIHDFNKARKALFHGLV